MRIFKVIIPILVTVAAGTIAEAPLVLASSRAVNVCALPASSAVTAITGISSKCVKGATFPGPGSTAATATWPGKARGENLTVTIDTYATGSFLSLAKKNLAQGFPSGKPSKLAGVGSGAYEGSAAGIAVIHFSVGNDIVYINLSTTVSSPKIPLSLVAFAKSISSKIAQPGKTTSAKTTATAPDKTTTTVSGPLAGSWSGTYNGAFSGTFALSWQQSGTQLSGTIHVSSLGSSSTSVTGTVQGTKITFGTVGSQAIQYTGTYSGSSMSGTWTLGPASGSWSANKS